MYKIELQTTLKGVELNKHFHDGGDCLKRTYSTSKAASDAFDEQYKGNTIITCRVVPATE